MTRMSIRKATPDDFGGLLSMVHGLARHHGDTPSLALEALKRDTFDWYDVLVAQEGDALVGYAALLPTGQLQFGVRGMDIHHLFVHANRRGQGVGKALLEACMAHANSRGCAYVTVGTALENQTAQEVYLGCGFERRDAAGPRFTRRTV